MAKLAATFSLITRGSIAVGSAVVARELFLLSHPMADQWDDLPTNGSRQMYVVSDRGWVGKCVVGKDRGQCVPFVQPRPQHFTKLCERQIRTICDCVWTSGRVSGTDRGHYIL